jgi:hypothetical protein
MKMTYLFFFGKELAIVEAINGNIDFFCRVEFDLP